MAGEDQWQDWTVDKKLEKKENSKRNHGEQVTTNIKEGC